MSVGRLQFWCDGLDSVLQKNPTILSAWLAAMLFVEVWAHWHESGHVKRPTVVLAVGMLVLGLLHGRIAGAANRRRGLWVDDAGIRVSPRPFRRFRATWSELAAIDLTPREARIVRRDGTPGGYSWCAERRQELLQREMVEV